MSPDNLYVRTAVAPDFNSILEIDDLANKDKSRSAFISRSITKSECAVCLLEGRVAGYVIFNRDFFDQMFIWLLFVSSDLRRVGVGTLLINYVESKCAADSSKLFTSTNQSNTVMQNLMKKLGFSRTGLVENLDEGDPELFYFKKVKSG
jgi:ribosomal protein S18 acetylase RimI-like enzyme